MSSRRLLSRDLPLFLVLLTSLPLLFASSAQSEPSRLGPSWGVDRIRSQAQEGEVVTLEAHVVSISRKRFFILEDASGEQIMAVIPDHLMRDTGKPEQGETIRVRGKYDHKTFLDVEKSTKSDPDSSWGIRVSAIDRNVSSSGRNPKHANPSRRPAEAGTKPAPAAPLSAVPIATPNTPKELKARLSAARQRALGAQKELESANAAVARGEYRNVEGTEKEALAASQKRAQQEFDEAAAAIGSLVEEARASGVDPKLIELYEAGVTKPRR